MTDAAALVRALYQRLGRWQRVADAVNAADGVEHSAGYYWQVASGRIERPSDATVASIKAATESPERLLKSNFSKKSRFGLTVDRNVGLRLRSVKIRNGWTWDELGLAALKVLEGDEE